MEKTRDQQTRTESRAQLVEQVKACLQSSHYSRAADLLRRAAAESPDDEELAELERLAQDGVKRTAEANRLITESQELFAAQKSGEAIQLLRKAYELDKNNTLARAILANALVEQAHSIVESDWLEAEKLTNQALNLNPAHPTAKTIRSAVEDRKTKSSADDWVAQARNRQSSGDLFAALAWVAEGLAVHPDDPKLVQIQDEIQRDQGARRRQTRRGDLENLRKMEAEIRTASDVAAKQAIAERIQAIAANYWTDGEILSIANALLLRLGLVAKEGTTPSSQRKGATLILHVPRHSAPEPPRSAIQQVPPNPAVPSQNPPAKVAQAPVGEAPKSEVSKTQAPQTQAPPNPAPRRRGRAPVVPPSVFPTSSVPPTEIPPSKVAPSVAPPDRVVAAEPAPQPPAAQTITAPAAAASAAKVSSRPAARTLPSKQSEGSNTTTLIVAAMSAVVILLAAIFFYTRKHPAGPVATTAAVQPTTSVPATSSPISSIPAVSAPTTAAPAQSAPEPTPAAVPQSSETTTGRVLPEGQPAAGAQDGSRELGTLVVVAGQDNAKVFLNGKLQRQFTQGGQLRLPNLANKDYVVQVSKPGFQDPPAQKIRIGKGEQATIVFTLQPQAQSQAQAQPRMASLSIQGGAPGTTVLVDQTPVGTVQADGTLTVSNVSPGDHTVELRKDRFKPRQFKEHFVVGGAVSLVVAGALEAAPAELKITFTPADASVAIAKAGDLPTMVMSGAVLNVAPGNYTLTARTAERFTRSSTFEIVAGQSKSFDLALAPNGMSKWDDPGAWKREGDAFVRKGGDFVLYGVSPTSGTFVFSAMPKGRVLQWVLNYTDSQNYVLFQLDDTSFHRSVIRNGQKRDEIIVPDKGDKKSSRSLHILVTPTEIVHQIQHGNSWVVLDRWTPPGVNPSQGKFGFYLPGGEQAAVSSFAHYADLNIR